MSRQKANLSHLPQLPVLTCVDALRESLAQGHAILAAEAGSGKTTLVPLLLRDEPWLERRRILMLEPRRPAARMAAQRMAALCNETVGESVGYRVRFERKVSAATRIEVLTEGLLIRRLQSDPELRGVGLVIFDEFHERSIQSDLALALCLDVATGLRDDLRLLAMSASLDAAPLCALMGARTITAAGRQYPVEVVQSEQDAEQRDPVPACLRALARALQDTAQDVLVFLPGRREIERMRSETEGRWGQTVEVQTLYGDMPSKAQDAVLQGRTQRRRVIIATDIAETSLTIEGLGAVVDSGLARKPRFDPNTGLTRLQTTWISKASALQRAGRAGRLGPGLCYRTWTAARHKRLADWTAPEILDADLAPVVLELANWGIGAARDLLWLDPPPPAHWSQAVSLLRQLGALDDAARITAVGRAMTRFPAHPRLAHALAIATDEAAQRLAADVAALLSERDPLRGNGRGADIGWRLDALSQLRQGRPVDAAFDSRALRQLDRVAQQLRRLCEAPVEAREPAQTPPAQTPGQCVALAYPDRVALCTSGDGRRYLMRNGRAAMLDEEDPLRGTRYLAVAGVDAGRRDGRIWLAAALEDERFEALFADQISLTRELRWDAGRADLGARAVRRLDALRLSDEAVALNAEDPTGEFLLEQVRAQGLAAFFADPLALRARVDIMRGLEPQDWPDLSEPALLDSAEEWLLPWLRSGEGVRQLRRLDLGEMLRGRLGWQAVDRLDRALPESFDTPAGTRRRYRYGFDGPPVLAAPLQELLGLANGPQLAGGRVTPVIHLLSPAGRPLQVTADLAGFWAGAYEEVKKEMRGRYPKHFWPDDPAHAKATRFTKRRM